MSSVEATEPKARRGPRGAELKVLRRLFGYLRPYRAQMAAAALALIVAAATVLTFGRGLRWLIDEGFARGEVALLDHALLAMFAVVAVLSAATYARSYFVAWLGERVAADLRRAVFQNLLRQSPGFFELTPTGELLSRLTTDTTVLQVVVGSTASMALRNTLLVSGGLLMMALASPKLTLLVIGVVPLVVAPIVLFGRQVRRLSRASQDRLGDVGAEIDQTLNAIHIVQAFNQEAAGYVRFRDRVEEALAASMARTRARSGLAGLIILLVFSAIGVILWIGGHDLLAGRISAGELSAFVFYAVVVAASVGAISEFMADLQRAAGASERLFELIDARSILAIPAAPVPLPEPAKGAVAFEAVTFSYPSRPERPALDGIGFEVKPGETVALVGPSGAGKSTVLQLLLRFHDPAEGRVLVDGVDVKTADPAALRARMALVPQEPVIFSADVADNIRFGRPAASDEEVRAAAAAAAATEFIDKLPDGYRTHLGEKGVRLSGGQRQRIALARAILRDPAILLLDEATSALDAESERLVQTALERLMVGRTVLVIAHRLATVQRADRILVLDQGKLIASGTHASLTAAGGLYARLAALQFNPAAASPSAAD